MIEVGKGEEDVERRWGGGGGGGWKGTIELKTFHKLKQSWNF